jgi:hypothetical protein
LGIVQRPAAPAAANGFQAAHAGLLLASYQHLTGRRLLPDEHSCLLAARELYFAPFVMLSHEGGEDPVFTYANLTAQILFAMPWHEIVGLPSRYSAEPLVREARQRLLDTVSRQGYIDDYQGVRIARDGRRFEIHRATVWNLTDAAGELVGQAATFAEWTELAAGVGRAR